MSRWTPPSWTRLPTLESIRSLKKKIKNMGIIFLLQPEIIEKILEIKKK
jgi:hypothetical protein